MEELKNIRNFEEFKNSVNEELLWDAIKNLFSKVFGKIDKQLADAVANFTKKLDGSKNWQESLTYYDQAIKAEQANMDEDLKAVKGPLGLRKVLGDNASIIYIQLQELSNKYQSAEVAAKNVFAGQPEAALFNFDKVDDFNNNLTAAMNAKIIELNKTAQNPYDEKQLTEYLNKNKDINAVNIPAQNYQETKPNPKGEVKTELPGGQPTESYYFEEDIKLFEAGEQPAAPATNQPAAPATNQPAAPVTNSATPATNQPVDTPISKLSTGGKTWMTNNLYGHSLTKVKQIKPPANVGNADAFDTVAKGSKATTLTGSVAKLLRGIVNIPLDKKGDLIKVRDTLAVSQGKTPDDLKKEMPL